MFQNNSRPGTIDISAEYPKDMYLLVLMCTKLSSLRIEFGCHVRPLVHRKLGLVGFALKSR